MTSPSRAPADDLALRAACSIDLFDCIIGRNLATPSETIYGQQLDKTIDEWQTLLLSLCWSAGRGRRLGQQTRLVGACGRDIERPSLSVGDETGPTNRMVPLGLRTIVFGLGLGLALALGLEQLARLAGRQADGQRVAQ